MSANVKVATECWGNEIPDWVAVLARECDASSQRRVGQAMRRSGSLVNQVLHNKYSGNLETVRAIVEGLYMATSIECPALGNILTHVCQEWRDKAKKPSTANIQRVQMFRACSSCPRNRGEGANV